MEHFISKNFTKICYDLQIVFNSIKEFNKLCGKFNHLNHEHIKLLAVMCIKNSCWSKYDAISTAIGKGKLNPAEIVVESRRAMSFKESFEESEKVLVDLINNLLITKGD